MGSDVRICTFEKNTFWRQSNHGWDFFFFFFFGGSQIMDGIFFGQIMDGIFYIFFFGGSQIMDGIFFFFWRQSNHGWDFLNFFLEAFKSWMGFFFFLEAVKSWMGFFFFFFFWGSQIMDGIFFGQVMDGKSFTIQCFFSAVLYDAVITFHPAWPSLFSFRNSARQNNIYCL